MAATGLPRHRASPGVTGRHRAPQTAAKPPRHQPPSYIAFTFCRNSRTRSVYSSGYLAYEFAW
ncbi:MAG: hypothetical protein IKX45_02815, partial [Bacteroidales bacterium]|nr:hypothetical protein [Bacteroidales bacterium]